MIKLFKKLTSYVDSERKKKSSLSWMGFLPQQKHMRTLLSPHAHVHTQRTQSTVPSRSKTLEYHLVWPSALLSSSVPNPNPKKKLKNLLGACISPIYVYRGVVAASAVVRGSTKIQNLPPKNARNKTTEIPHPLSVQKDNPQHSRQTSWNFDRVSSGLFSSTVGKPHARWRNKFDL